MRILQGIVAAVFILSVHSIPYRGNRYLHFNQRPLLSSQRWSPASYSDEDPTSRIVGGTPARSGQVSYQLYMKGQTSKGERYHCGAALVDEYNIQFAITAAHCVYDGYPHHSDAVDPKKVRIVAGEISLKTKSGREQYRTPHRIVMHENFKYDEDHPDDDIAIMFYRKAFTVNFYVQPIALPDYLWAQPRKMTISGWGSTTPLPNLRDPDTLQVSQIDTLDNGICGHFYKWNPAAEAPQVTWKQICILDLNRNNGFCDGDSGGPGVAWNKTSSKLYLAGIGSYYLGDCGDKDRPAVYTRVSAYTDWIRSQVAEYIRLHLSVGGR
ncbi:Trypsin-1 [Orchesella cincta]|uniref:Trypsin-1 n=1 Tax=Orchesella cincta TaxID=48709 RepID=A0A1D2M751_ORCCI|nr:Trypsin-1 [Orchesella cincta]